MRLKLAMADTTQQHHANLTEITDRMQNRI